MTRFRLRLKQMREKAQKSEEEVAIQSGISVHAYYDLEQCDGDLETAVSLGELSRICSTLGTKAALLFGDDQRSVESLTPDKLAGLLRIHLEAAKMSLSQFEDEVGFRIGPFLEDIAEISNWNVDCLRSVCNAVGEEWRGALL